MIGVFDSGFGGLTVFKPLREKFKEYDFIYFGDNARAPYGSHSHEEIFKYTSEALDWLFKNRCKLAILACNSASSQALRQVQQEYLPKYWPDKKVLGVLIPVAEAVAKDRPEKVGILATEATISSGAYEREILKLAPQIKIIPQAAPLLVPLIESGKINDEETKETLKNYLEVFKKNPPAGGIKDIVLGCTHYPFIEHLIRAEMPDAKIFDSPSIIPPSLENYFLRHPEIEQKISRNKTSQFFTSGDPDQFDQFAKKFLNLTANSQRVIMQVEGVA